MGTCLCYADWGHTNYSRRCFTFPHPETAPPNHHIQDFRFIILEGKSYVDQFPCITQSSLPHASIWSYPYFKVCIYLERTSFTHPCLTFPLACFSGEQIPTSNNLYHAILYPKRCQRSKCVPQNQMTPSLLGACLSSDFVQLLRLRLSVLFSRAPICAHEVMCWLLSFPSARLKREGMEFVPPCRAIGGRGFLVHRGCFYKPLIFYNISSSSTSYIRSAVVSSQINVNFSEN